MTIIDFEEYKKKKYIQKLHDEMPDEFELDNGIIFSPIVYTITDEVVYFALRCEEHEELLFMKCAHQSGILDTRMRSLLKHELDEFLRVIEEQDLDLNIY